MSPSLPAVRAYPEKRHPGLDVDIRDDLGPPSPGAGIAHPFLAADGFNDDQDGSTVLTTGTPVQTTTFIVNAPASDPTPTTVVQASTSIVIIVTPKGSSIPASVLNSTLPAITNTTDTDASSSSTSPSTLPPSSLPISATSETAPRPTTSPTSQGPDFGSTVAPEDSFLTDPESGMKKSHGPSGGVVAAIVIVLLFALCAAAFFVFRSRRIRKRVARRVTWTTGLGHLDFDSLEKGPSHVPPTSSHKPNGTIEPSPTGQGSAQGEAQAPFRNIARKPPLPYSPVPSPTQPLPSYNNPPHVAIPYVPPAATPAQDSASVQDVPMLVRVTFVPQLPDELAITPGETLYIRTKYDDGWASCVNTRGKEGMVPLECLEGDDGQLIAPSLVGTWRRSRRASSLGSQHGLG